MVDVETFYDDDMVALTIEAQQRILVDRHQQCRSFFRTLSITKSISPCLSYLSQKIRETWNEWKS